MASCVDLFIHLLRERSYGHGRGRGRGRGCGRWLSWTLAVRIPVRVFGDFCFLLVLSKRLGRERLDHAVGVC